MASTMPSEGDLRAQALEILESTPLIDGHNDWAWAIHKQYGNAIQTTEFAPDSNLRGQVDIKRLVEGRMGGMFLSAYQECPSPEDDFSDATHFELVRKTLQQIDLIHRLVEKYPDRLQLVSGADEVLPTFRAGKMPCFIGLEGLHMIGNSASVLRMYWKLGVRYVTLTHVLNNLYADSSTSTKPAHDGLSDAGRQMIRELNRLGIIIDISHVSDATAHQALDLSAAPVLFTHSNSRHLHDHPRNVWDPCLDKLKKNEGVIMVTFVPAFTHPDHERASVKDLVDHVEYIAARIGYDHIGVGSDLDGTAKIIEGITDAAGVPGLVVEMLRRGIARPDIEKMLGLNVIRVLKAVEDVAKSMKGELALEDKIAPVE